MQQNSFKSTRVLFFQVPNNGAKLKIVCETVQSHFNKKEPFLIIVEDTKSQEFLDELLWKFPETSFLPHTLSDTPVKDFIAITKTKQNINEAHYVFNLCSTPLLIDFPFRTIYELEDLTSPNKNKFSSLRFDAYKAARYLIESHRV